jgi:hypothetical protein
LTRIRTPLAAALAGSALALAASAALAQMGSTPAQRTLYEGGTPARLRLRLAAHADSVLAKSPFDAGETFAWIGASHLRSGHADSARAAYARGYALLEIADNAYGYAEALLAGGRPADAESAARFVAGLETDDAGAASPEPRLWRAWAHAHLAGAPAARAELEAARALLAAPTAPTRLRERWTRRLAPLWLEAHVDAWPLLRELAIRSRGHDPALLLLAREAAMGHAGSEPFDRVLATGIARQDSLAALPLRAVGGRPLAVRGAGGAALGAWVFPAAPRAPLLVLVNDPDPAGGVAPDSLVVQLRRDGIALALLDPRGSGRSAIPGCALADDWGGREDALTDLVAHDLQALVQAAAAASGADPHRVAVGAVGPLALAAARAGALGPLVLIDPVIAPTDRGPFLDALAAEGMPVFFQTGPASVEANSVIDAIAARVGDPDPRIAESSAPGHGFALFRAGPKEGKRLSAWLRETIRAARPAPTPRATPPARRR